MEPKFKLCPKHHNFRLAPGSLAALNLDCTLYAFTTKDHELVLYDLNNNRCTSIHKSQQDFTALLFTRDYLFAADGGHDLLMFSLVSGGKLKKKGTSHRSKITKIDYCPNRHLIVSQSKESCILWNSNTLKKQKTLSCSTSFFSQTLFSNDGRHLVNLFLDGSVMFWDLDTFASVESGIGMEVQEAASGCLALQERCYGEAAIIGVASDIYMADSFCRANSQDAAPAFRRISKVPAGDRVTQAYFLQNWLIVNTLNSGVFAARITTTENIVKDQVRFIEIPLDKKRLAINGDGSTLLCWDSRDILAYDFIAFMLPLLTVVQKRPFVNPLLNTGSHCAGGFNNEEGCANQFSLPEEYDYGANQQIMENIYKSALIREEDLAGFSIPKLKEFLRKNHRLAEKHRAISYKYILSLPSNIRAFKALERLGSHSSTKLLHLKYPIKNQKLLNTLKVTLDLLAHYCPIFGEADCVPVLAFPLVSIFGEDQLLCFEVLQRLLTHYLSFVFESFPLAHADVVRNIENIIQSYDIGLLGELKSKKPGLITKISWSLITSLFSDVLSRENYLSLLDNFLVEKENPTIILYQVAAFIIYFRSSILALTDSNKETQFLETEKNIHLPKYLQIVRQLAANHSAKVDYSYPKYDWKTKEYIKYQKYPKEALEMYRSKRLLAEKDLQHQVQADQFRKEISHNIEKVLKQEKINAQNQQKVQEALRVRYEVEQAQAINLKRTDERERIERLKTYIEMIGQNLQTQEALAQTAVQLPVRANSLEREVDLTNKTSEQLDVLENKLIKMLMNRPPPALISGAVMHPVLGKIESRKATGLQNHMNAQLLEGVHRITDLQRKNQERKWEMEMEKVYKRV